MKTVSVQYTTETSSSCAINHREIVPIFLIAKISHSFLNSTVVESRVYRQKGEPTGYSVGNNLCFKINKLEIPNSARFWNRFMMNASGTTVGAENWSKELLKGRRILKGCSHSRRMAYLTRIFCALDQEWTAIDQQRTAIDQTEERSEEQLLEDASQLLH